MDDIKVYTFFTDTHKVFLKHFIDSFPFEEGFDLDIKYLPQECPSGSFNSEGWKNTMYKKIKYLLYSLEHTKENEFFIHSDIDVQFFTKIKKDIINLLNTNNMDVLFQRDDKHFGVALCMGFFACRKNEKTTNFFNSVLNNLDKFPNDQVAVNRMIGSFNLNYDLLPERYYSVGVENGLWDENKKNIYIPKEVFVHHANFTVGVENKIKLLNFVKEKVNG